MPSPKAIVYYPLWVWWPLPLNLSIAIVSLGLTYHVKIVTLASTVFKKSTFQKMSYLNALGRKFDLNFK